MNGSELPEERFDGPTPIEEVRARLMPYAGKNVMIDTKYEDGVTGAIFGKVLEEDDGSFSVVSKENTYRNRDLEIAEMWDLTVDGKKTKSSDRLVYASVSVIPDDEESSV